MEIKRISDAYQVASYGRIEPKTKKTGPEKKPESTKESVELSPSSLNLQKVKEAVQKAPEIRIPIVEEIMQRIKNNDYPISLHAEEALDKMIHKGIF
jgi:anti-sigma28 factor (negative regulator of flagellin synthesis)